LHSDRVGESPEDGGRRWKPGLAHARRNAVSGSRGFGRSSARGPGPPATPSRPAGVRATPGPRRRVGNRSRPRTPAQGRSRCRRTGRPTRAQSKLDVALQHGGVRAGRSLPRPVKHHQGVAGLPARSGRQLVSRVIAPRVLLGCTRMTKSIGLTRIDSGRFRSPVSACSVSLSARRRRGPASLQDAGGEQRAEIQRSLPLAEPGMLVSADDVSGAGLVLREAEELARLGEAQDDGECEAHSTWAS